MGESNVMYIGPTVRGVVKYGDTFSGGIPERLKKLAGAKPVVRNLIVPLSGITEAVKESNTEGTALAIAYDKVLSMPESETKKIMEGV